MGVISDWVNTRSTMASVERDPVVSKKISMAVERAHQKDAN